MLKFTPGDTPIVQKGNMSLFIVLTENETGRKYVYPCYYLNGYLLEHHENCPCENCCDEDYDGGGHPSTGWYSEQSDFDFDSTYERIDCKVLAFAKLPNVIDVVKSLNPAAQRPHIGANKNPPPPEGLIPGSPPPPPPAPEK